MICQKMVTIIPAQVGYVIRTQTFTDGMAFQELPILFWGLTDDGVICAVCLNKKKGMGGACWGEIIASPIL